MSASYYRQQLDRKRSQRIDAEQKAGEYRVKETRKRSDANKARSAAVKTSSTTTARTKLREAERREQEAAAAGKDEARWLERASRYRKEELALEQKLSRVGQTESDAADRRRRREQAAAERVADSERALLLGRVDRAEALASVALRELRAPKPEKLRILLLGAASDGDLRVGREQKRIRAAVQSALHRDLVEFDVRPAATADDLLDGITGFRPHVVHFSGHSDHELIVFEDDRDEPHDGAIVTAAAFAAALRATDDPPLLVVLNSCNSASQLDDLLDSEIPFAIGMSGEIDDGDAITYAARFYASVANGQSVLSAHLAGQAALELSGLDGGDLPTLANAHDVDPGRTVLVEVPAESLG